MFSLILYYSFFLLFFFFFNDTATTEIYTLSLHDALPISACAFSPDGTTFVSASRDHSLVVWDRRSRRPRLRLLGHTWWVQGCAFSPDGTTILSAGDYTARLWDAHTGKALGVFAPQPKAVMQCGYSSDGTLVYTTGGDGWVKVWDLATREERLALPLADVLPILAVHPLIPRIAVAGDWNYLTIL